MKIQMIGMTTGKRVWKYPAAWHPVPDTDGLLAVTKQQPDKDWDITHVPTGFAFPSQFPSVASALRAAKNLFERFPSKQLRCKTHRGVIGTVKREEVLAMYDD